MKKNINYGWINPVFSIAFCLLLAISAAAQIKLRSALDYDADGKADPAVFRQTDNTWYFLKSNGSLGTGIQWGTVHTDTLAPGDYDGDGKTDIGVWRETNGTFYVLKSQDGGLLAAAWGYSTDSPIAAYDTH